MTVPTDSGKTGPGDSDQGEAKPATPVPPRGGAKKKPNRPSSGTRATTPKATTAKAPTAKAPTAKATGAGATGATGAARASGSGRPAAGRPAPRNSGTKSSTGGMRSSNNRRQAEWQARRRRNMIYSGIAVAVIVVIAGVFIAIKATGGSSKSSSKVTVTGSNNLTASQADISPLDPTDAAKVSGVALSALADASKGTTVPTLTGGGNISKQPPLTANGHPEILYIGAGFCPYCAAERWPMVVALSKFGTFTNLGQTASSPTDTNPSTPTYSFYLSTYTSPYITFTSVETTTQDESQALQSPTTDQAKLWKALDSEETIPFIDFANKYLITGATYTSSSMSNQSFASVADQVGNNNTVAGKGIDQTAGAMIKSICSLTGDQPATVCSAIGT